MDDKRVSLVVLKRPYLYDRWFGKGIARLNFVEIYRKRRGWKSFYDISLSSCIRILRVCRKREYEISETDNTWKYMNLK